MESQISDERVRVRFFTKYENFRVTDAPFAIPSKLGRYGLSEVVNHLLELSSPQPFDFLVNDELLRLPLKKFLTSHRISLEDVVSIEYIPALSLSNDESPSTELPSWIGCIDSTFDPYISAGCYDGKIQFIDKHHLQIAGTVSAHELPIRDLVGWTDSTSVDQSQMLASASKDHSIKCWSISNNITSNQNKVVCHQVAHLTGHLNSVESVDIHSSGNRHLLLSGDWTGMLLGWSVTDIKTAPSDPPADDTDRKKKKRKAAAGQVAAPAIVDVKPLFSIKAHAQCVSDICVLDEDARLYSGSWDHSIKEWDIERQDCLATFAGAKVVTSLDFSPASRLLVSSHPDGRTRLWDSRLREGATSRGAFTCDNHWLSQVKWQGEAGSGSGFVFCAADYQGRLQLWDIRATSPLGLLDTHAGKALCLGWMDAGQTDTGDASMEGVEPAVGGGRSRILSGGTDCILKSSLVC